MGRAVTTFPKRSEFRNAKSLLDDLGLPCQVLSPEPGFRLVAEPTVVVESQVKSALYQDGGETFVCSGWVDYAASLSNEFLATDTARNLSSVKPECGKTKLLPLPVWTTAGCLAAEFAEAAAVVETAGEGVVAAVFAGVANLEAAFGFGDGGGVDGLLKGLVSAVCGCMGNTNRQIAAADDLAGAEVAGEVFLGV